MFLQFQDPLALNAMEQERQLAQTAEVLEC